MRPRRNPRRGYTLVEVALGAAVGAVLMLGILKLLRSGLAMFSRSQEAQSALQSATMISEILHRDLRYMVVPIVAPPTRTEEVGDGGANGSSSSSGPVDQTFQGQSNQATGGPNPSNPNQPTGDPDEGTPEGEQAEPDVVNPESFETLLPFTKWDGSERRPVPNEDVWLDLTDPSKTPGPGEYHPTVLMFYRTKVGTESGGLFGIGGGEKAGYQLERVWYRARLSRKYADQGVYVLRRDSEEVRVEVSDVGGNHTEKVVPAFNPNQETEDGKQYNAFYFKRLVVTMHDAPEAGLAGGGTTPNAGTAAGSNPLAGAPEPDTLYFARIMVAGATAGPGARRIEQKDGRTTDRSQKIDLMVNLIHLDGVSDRFRKRSLSMNWNAEMPLPED